jgi:hypothetical protein
MKISLSLSPVGAHTLRFDDIDLDGIARLMTAVGYCKRVQINDSRRNILGIWQAGELRQSAVEVARLTHLNGS